jgi:molybdopterin molybdotransferase
VGQNVRQAGEDIARGSVVLAAGRRIGAAQLGLLASLGVPEVRIQRRVRVAFFSSGDEIRSIGEPLAEGQIYDSNRYTLYGMLTELGCEVLDMGVIPDREADIKGALETAAGMADLILTSGGVSVGDADYIVAALRQLGTIHFSKVAIKPGRPLTFGHIGSTPFFGLPGNPVAVMITFLNFALPGIRRMMGEADQALPRFQVVCRSRLRKHPGRTEIQRGLLLQGEDGNWEVKSTGRQGSGVLSSMSDGNCFIMLPAERATVEPGELVEVIPFGLFT